MANKKISELTPLNATPDANDILPLNDTSAGSTFSVKVSELQAATQSLADNLTDISLVSISNGTMLAANGSNYVSLGAIDATGLSNIRADLGLGTAATTASSDYATAAQGATADSATQPGDLGTAAALDVGTSANNIVQLDGAAKLPSVDGSQLTNLPSSAVEGTAVLSTGETGGTKFLREDGDNSCSWQTISITDENLRGTDNPHIGAFPNQSLKVLDSQPSGSALMVADSNGLKFAVGTGASIFVIKGSASPSRLAEASELPAFIISKDSGEPDIELTDSDGEVYSIVTGDSDTLGANGLPVRQGYQLPSIGANPAPLLISGGTIS